MLLRQSKKLDYALLNSEGKMSDADSNHSDRHKDSGSRSRLSDTVDKMDSNGGVGSPLQQDSAFRSEEESLLRIEAKKAECAAVQAELHMVDMEEQLAHMRAELAQRKGRVAQLNQQATGTFIERPTLHPHQPKLSPHLDQPTLKSLASDHDLNMALEALKTAHLQDILDPDPTMCVGSPAASKSGKGKYDVLYISDFVTKPMSSNKVEEKEIAKGLWLKVKNNVKTEDVTVPQWLSANARILLTLLDTLDTEAVKKYLRYTAKIGDYLQMSEVASVMLLDEDHRKLVSRDGREWDDIDGDKRYFYLEKERAKQYRAPVGRAPQSKKRGPVDEAGKPICLSFNSQAGCTRSWCNFSHVCSINGCTESHPRHQHNAPPRFRTQPSSKPSQD